MLYPHFLSLIMLTLGGIPARFERQPGNAPAVSVTLSEWKVELSARSVAAGAVTFTIANTGTIPHAFEIEGQGIERETAVIQPGARATLTLQLKPGSYEVYCPVGQDSHKKLGMDAQLSVGGSADEAGSPAMEESMAMGTGAAVSGIQVTGGGPVIQILPGPFAFPDSAAPILASFGNEREGLESQIQNGPYSNNIARSAGTFTFAAWDKGAVRDSVDGTAEFTTRDGTRWKLVLDRVQTKDVAHHPRFGGVIMGLYYHGNTGVHTPLVPTINSAVALWAVGHLYRNGQLVSDNAQTHVMLLSHTRRAGDFALACWDCSRNRIDELQLQILPGPGEPKFDAPGGFLFLNWEKSGSRKLGS
ncbi:MAG TPA: cupredoxin domain-containing protein [Gemmatimonadales bacterium]|nr:cupredoxin domain-containing protein [Gemmatimonadales bacterium]